MQTFYSANTDFALDFERRKMVDLAMALGLDHPAVIEQSQRLDVLVNEVIRNTTNT
jgi:hypothetical protein